MKIKDNTSGKLAEFVKDTFFLIVLYEMPLINSISFNSLKKSVSLYNDQLYNPVEILICDNSPEPFQKLDEANVEGYFSIHYLWDNLNPGVSKSYNRGAELGKLMNKKWMLILDQDTLIPLNGLKSYFLSVIKYPLYPVYAPQLICNNLLLSPCKEILNRGSHFKNIVSGVHAMKNKNVLNSGLLISLEAFEKVEGYDENVWLYFSDFVFFNRLKKRFSEFIVIDCTLQHEISSSDYSNIDIAKKDLIIIVKELMPLVQIISFHLLCILLLLVYGV